VFYIVDLLDIYTVFVSYSQFYSLGFSFGSTASQLSSVLPALLYTYSQLPFALLYVRDRNFDFRFRSLFVFTGSFLLPGQYGRSCPVFVRYLWTLRSVLVFVYHFRTFPIFSSALEDIIRPLSEVFEFFAHVLWTGTRPTAAPIPARLVVDFIPGISLCPVFFTHAQFSTFI
jgi:hypothetical protein